MINEDFISPENASSRIAPTGDRFLFVSGEYITPLVFHFWRPAQGRTPFNQLIKLNFNRLEPHAQEGIILVVLWVKDSLSGVCLNTPKWFYQNSVLMKSFSKKNTEKRSDSLTTMTNAPLLKHGCAIGGVQCWTIRVSSYTNDSWCA